MTLFQHLHRRFMNFAQRFQPILQSTARDYFLATLNRTRYCSNIAFLKSCLQSRTIPRGFSLNYHRGPTSLNTTQQRLNTTLSTCSNRLMKINLQDFDRIASELSTKRENLKSILRDQCTSTCYSKIQNLTHILNQEYYEHLKDIKARKLHALDPGRNARNHENQLVITIPEDLQLSATERSVLSKGLKFVPTKPKVDKFTLKTDLEAFYRRLKLHAHFNDPNKTIRDTATDPVEMPPASIKKWMPKSTWTPREEVQTSLGRYISTCRAEIGDMSDLPPVRKQNMSKDENRTLKELSRRTDVVIKPADKGGAVVVWKKELYVAEAEKHLNDETYYKKETYDRTSENNKKVQTAVEDEIEKGNIPSNAQHLIVEKPRCAKFYMLPKVHKTGNPGRPIVSACSCPTERISSYLDEILHPIVTNLPSYTRDSSDTITKIKDLNLQGNDLLLFTMDVKSLYTNIPHEAGLRALRHFLNRRSSPTPPTNTVLRLAELVLRLNSFEFQGKFFNQVKGVAMGTRMGPSYANIFLGYLEKKLSLTSVRKPELYLRYIDDIFGLTTMKKSELTSFIQVMESLHPAISFTHEISTTNIDFLDATFHVQDGKVQSSVHYKPTDSHNYLRYSSFHPQATKNAIPYSQLLRLRRLTSCDTELKEKRSEMIEFFKDRDFPQSVLERAERRSQNISQEEALQPKSRENTNRIPFVTTFHPCVSKVFKILQKHWNILSDDTTTSTLFDTPPICATRRCKNLKDILVHTKEIDDQDQLGGTYPCGRNRCLTCAYTNKEPQVVAPDGVWNIRNSYQCTSKNLVYVITCLQCGQLYIGETKRLLAERFREHRRDVEKKSRTSLVALHFNRAGHSVDDMTVGVMATCNSDAQRKALEMRLITKLGTIDPRGMNIDVDYNV